jgi:tRNA (guanine37-N1)-methyltransferase
MDIEALLESHGKALHIDMIEALRRNMAEVVQADRQGVLLKTHGYGAWMVSVFDREADQRFCRSVGHDGCPVVCHQAHSIELLESFGFRKDLSCVQAFCPRSTPYEEDGTHTFRPVTIGDEQTILGNYRLGTAEYVRDRIRSGTMLAVEWEGRLAGFMGLHAEGAMGMLEILPFARRRGLAFALEKHCCNLLLEAGQVPFCQIVEGNEPSAMLHRKLGFAFSEGRVFWFD